MLTGTVFGDMSQKAKAKVQLGAVVNEGGNTCPFPQGCFTMLANAVLINWISVWPGMTFETEMIVDFCV